MSYTHRYYPDLYLDILKDSKSHFLVKKVIDFAIVDLKKTSKDGEVFLGILWQGTQSKYIRSCCVQTRKHIHITVTNVLCHYVCIVMSLFIEKLPHKFLNATGY